jgi:hypothetical protein
MSKKTKTTTSQKTVTTPTNPEWVTKANEGYSNKIMDLGKVDPYSLVAGPTALQNQAVKSASALGADTSKWDSLVNMATPTIGQRSVGPQSVTNTTANSASLLDNLKAYMSPYTNDVVRSTLAGFDQNAGMTQAQQALDLARSGAFGGSGAAITQSMTNQGLAMARAQQEAGLRDQAFNTGAGLSNMDANRFQEANILNAQMEAQAKALNANLAYQAMVKNADLGYQTDAQNAALALQGRGQTADMLMSGDANTRQNVQLQGVLGSDMRAIDQARLNAPIDLLKTQVAMNQAIPANLFRGETSDITGTQTSKTSDPLGTLGSLAMMVALPGIGTALGAGLGALGLGAGATSAITGGAKALAAGNALRSI